MSSSGGGVTVTSAVSGQQRAQPPAVAAVAAATPLNPAAVEFRPAPIDVTAVAQEVMMEQQPAVLHIIYSLRKFCCSNISLIEILNQLLCSWSTNYCSLIEKDNINMVNNRVKNEYYALCLQLNLSLYTGAYFKIKQARLPF